MSIFTSTIAAISTPPGKGGVALIRISGENAFGVAERVFRPRGGRAVAEMPPRYAVYGDIYLGEDKIDDGILTLYSAPNSYTGEDIAEISCHGGALITRTVLEAVLLAGAVPAEAGEFTRRAFVNGRLSLTEAEAIGNLLDAKSLAQITLASSDSRGRLAREIQAIRESLTSLLSSIYARIDYPDEDLGDFTDGESREILAKIRLRLERLIRSYRTGRAINEGIDTVICGKPNVGKSTLYNLILGEDAAIVTDIEGTTRDILERRVALSDVMLNLSDTAGIRESRDEVEKIGIERTRERIEKCELVLAVFDLSRPFDERDAELASLLRESGKTVICILNKADICDTGAAFDASRLGALLKNSVKISARDGDALELSALVASLFTDGEINPRSDAIVASARQNAALKEALYCIDCAIQAYDDGLASDLASGDIERALGAVALLDGRAVADEVVSDIFAKFCVGK